VVACTDWIAARCFGLRFFTGLRADDVDVIIGWFGYSFGPEGLDDVIDSLYGGSPGGVRTEGSRPDTSEAGLNRALIAALTLPMAPVSERRVLELAPRMEQIDREHANRSAGLISDPMVVSARIVDSFAQSSRQRARPSSSPILGHRSWIIGRGPDPTRATKRMATTAGQRGERFDRWTMNTGLDSTILQPRTRCPGEG
jgi:hypothetical protein